VKNDETDPGQPKSGDTWRGRRMINGIPVAVRFTWDNVITAIRASIPAGPKGDKGDSVKGDPGSKGDKGDTGAAGTTLVGTVVIAQNAPILALALGIREVTVALTGAVQGERYMAVARSYKLNGGASVSGRPPNYAIIDATCNSAGNITVALNAPLLAIGQSYAITVDILKLNAGS
jgi:hypothetical protein